MEEQQQASGLAPVSPKLDSFRIKELPSNFYYLPGFITPEEEEELLSHINQQRWVQLAHRRLQVYPAQLTPKHVLLADKPLPAWLTARLAARFDELQLFAGTPHGQMNHVLINEYRPGQGIMAHEDGDAYAPVTVTVSLGSTTVLDIHDKTASPEATADQEKPGGHRLPRWRILQEERSLLVTRGGAYSDDLLHGIRETQQDEDLGPATICNWALLGDAQRFAAGSCCRGTRVSLTCRDVRRVSKLGSKLFGRRP